MGWACVAVSCQHVGTTSQVSHLQCGNFRANKSDCCIQGKSRARLSFVGRHATGTRASFKNPPSDGTATLNPQQRRSEMTNATETRRYCTTPAVWTMRDESGMVGRSRVEIGQGGAGQRWGRLRSWAWDQYWQRAFISPLANSSKEWEESSAREHLPRSSFYHRGSNRGQ